MWYTIKYDEQDAIMFFDNASRSIHFANDVSNPMHEVYLAWLAEGNEATEWTGE